MSSYMRSVPDLKMKKWLHRQIMSILYQPP